MLHCINPQAWQLNAVGIEKFMRRVAERERLGGIYSSLTPETPNGVLEEVIEELRQLFVDDEQLHARIDVLSPLVDFLLLMKAKSEQRPFWYYASGSASATVFFIACYVTGVKIRVGISLSGLAGTEKCVWPVASTELTLDETFDAWRAAALRNPVQHQHLDATTLDKWIDALFLNPLVMSRG